MTRATRLLPRRVARLQHVHSHKGLDKAWLSLLVKDVYELEGRPVIAQAAAPAFVIERRVADDMLVTETDLAAPNRALADVVLTGSAHAAAPTTSLDTSLAVGELRREVRVHGERRIHCSAGQLSFGPAQPFERAALSRRNAYGGELPKPRSRGRFGARARADEDRQRRFYPRNQAGRGFATYDELALLDGTLAPSQEDPSDPVEPGRLVVPTFADWLRAPLAADYGPIDAFEFPRAQFVLPYAIDARARVAELERGLIDRASLSPALLSMPERAAQCAQPGLSGALVGGEPVVAKNLFPGGGDVYFTLPSGPSGGAVDLPGAGRWPIALGLKTVQLSPDDGRLELTWAGRMEVALVYRAHDLAEVRTAVA